MQAIRCHFSLFFCVSWCWKRLAYVADCCCCWLLSRQTLCGAVTTTAADFAFRFCWPLANSLSVSLSLVINVRDSTCDSQRFRSWLSGLFPLAREYVPYAVIRPFVRPRLKPSSNGGCNRRLLLSELSTSSSFPACTMCSQLQLSPKTPKVQVAPKTPTPPMKQVEHPKRADRGSRYDETHLNGLSVASNSRQHIEKKCSRTTRT